MKVKYLLALALSHHAELLILDDQLRALTPYPVRSCCTFSAKS